MAEIERPSHVLIERASHLATSTLANALDEVGLHDRVVAGIGAVAPGLRMAGPAVTVKQIPGDYGSFASSDFRVGEMIDAARAGDVIAIDLAGAACSTWGGMASFAAKRKGIAGILVEGGVRDLEEIVEFAFPVFARHLVPTTGRMRLKLEAINAPVRIGGVLVEQGDLVVADGTGALALPRARAEEVIELAEIFARDDAAALSDLEAGLSFTEAMARYKRI